MSAGVACASVKTLHALQSPFLPNFRAGLAITIQQKNGGPCAPSLASYLDVTALAPLSARAPPGHPFF